MMDKKNKKFNVVIAGGGSTYTPGHRYDAT